MSKNPIKREEKIMNAKITKDERQFLDGFELGSKHDEAKKQLNAAMPDKVKPLWVVRLLNYITEMEAMEKNYEEEKKQHQLAIYDKHVMITSYNEEKTKREKLEKNVSRYFELDNRYLPLKGKGFVPECNELFVLKENLKKVGDGE